MKRNILLIDDDPIQHELFGCYLYNNQNFRLLNAADLNVAEQIIDTENVDLIFLDSRMPPYTDYRDTAPKLRNAGYTGDIVVISADVGAIDFKTDQTLGIKSHIDKQSLSLNTFPSVIDDIISSEAWLQSSDFVTFLSEWLFRMQVVHQSFSEFQKLNLASDYWEQLAPVVASIGRWIWNIDTGICQIDETLRDITKWPDGNLEFPAQNFLDRIYPDDLSRVNGAVKTTIDVGVPYKTQFRFIRFDETIVWFDGRGAIIDYEDGHRYLTGVNFDILEYKS